MIDWVPALPVPVVAVAASLAAGVAVMAVVASKIVDTVDENDENIKKITQLLGDIDRAQGDEKKKLMKDFWKPETLKQTKLRVSSDDDDDDVKAESNAAKKGKKSEHDDTCSICYDVISAPVNLRCGHTFCEGCLDSWRSKYGDWYNLEDEVWDKGCPLCREKLPPTAEMIARLKYLRLIMEHNKEKGDEENYQEWRVKYDMLKDKIGDYNEDDVIGKDKFSAELPEDLKTYVEHRDIMSMLNYVGVPPDKKRLEAGHPGLNYKTMLHIAALSGQTKVMSVLLQLGANVNALDLGQGSPFDAATLNMSRENDFFPSNALDTCKLLLEWGAEVPNKDEMIRDLSRHLPEDKDDDDDEESFYEGYQEIINLLRTELGGRRCEIVDMQNRTDLNGKTCLVDRYFSESGRYKVTLESTKEVFSMQPKNLMRRDRTPTDCGYYIEVMQEGKPVRQGYTSRQESDLYAVKGSLGFGCSIKTCKMVRYDFSSKEECQKFVKEVSEEGWDPVETEGEKVLKMLKGKKSKHQPSSVEELIAMLSM